MLEDRCHGVRIEYEREVFLLIDAKARYYELNVGRGHVACVCLWRSLLRMLVTSTLKFFLTERCKRFIIKN